MFFEILSASGKTSKTEAAKAAPTPQLHLVPGAQPLTNEDYKLFQQALKETPAGRWRHRHMHADASVFAKMNV